MPRQIQTRPIKEIPNPSKEDINTELFNQIYNIIKDWDISIPEYYNGYTSGNGSHAKLIYDVVKPAIRQDKINQILE